MSINEQFHIHIWAEKGDLKVARVYTGVNPPPTENLCSVAITNEQEEGYEPQFFEQTEVVVEAEEMKLIAGQDGTVAVVF